MHSHESKIHDNDQPVHVKWDALSQVLSKEKGGSCVRGLVAGVTPSRIDLQMQNNAWR